MAPKKKSKDLAAAPRKKTRGRKPGPKPKPTRVKLAEGNPGKRAINLFDRARKGELVPVPEYLDARAKKIFTFLSNELGPEGMIMRRDSMMLAGLAQAYSTLIGAQQQLSKLPEEERYVFKTKSGYQQQQPLLGIINTQLDRIRMIAPEFGLTPSSRSGYDEDMLARMRGAIDAGKVEAEDELESTLKGNGPAASKLLQ